MPIQTNSNSQSNTYACSHAKRYGFCKFGQACRETINQAKQVVQDCTHTELYGYCLLGEKCNSFQSRKKTQGKNFKHVLCTSMTKYEGGCKNKNCVYAHSEEERNNNCVEKTCMEFIKTGACSNKMCRYKHLQNRDEVYNTLQAQSCNHGSSCTQKFCCFNHTSICKSDLSDKVFIPELCKYVTLLPQDKIIIDLRDEDDEEEEDDTETHGENAEEEDLSYLEDPLYLAFKSMSI